MTQNIVVRLEKGDLVWFKELPIGLGTAGAKHFFLEVRLLTPREI